MNTWVRISIKIRINAPIKTDRITLQVPSCARVIITLIVIMQPAFLIIILPRKTQVLGHITHPNRRLSKRPVACRPYHLPGVVRELLRRPQVVIVIVVYLPRTTERQRLVPQIQVFRPRLPAGIRLGQQPAFQVIVIIGHTRAELLDPLTQRIVTVRRLPVAARVISAKRPCAHSGSAIDRLP